MEIASFNISMIADVNAGKDSQISSVISVNQDTVKMEVSVRLI